MLELLQIKDFAIIDEIDITFGTGMTVLTGETGAGKSILLDALGLVLGDRADSNSVRQGTDKAEVCAEFDITDTKTANTWLRENDLDNEKQCLVRRVVSVDGRSRAYINGTPVTLQNLRELGEKLIDIHGQHEHQSLAHKTVQRQLLDDYAANNDLLNEIETIYGKWVLAEKELGELREATKERNNRIELLSYQTTELDKLDLEENEVETLNEEHKRLANIDRITGCAQKALFDLYDNDDNSVYSQLASIMSELDSLSDADSKLKPISQLLNDCVVMVEESSGEIRNYLDHLDSDPGRFSVVEERLSLVIDIARKHQVEPGQLPDLHKKLKQELDQFSHMDEALDNLEQNLQSLATQYDKAAMQLTSKRKKTADKLSKLITAAMQTLAMEAGQFDIRVESDEIQFSTSGKDTISFNVSTNKGQTCRPLAKVASGGELSRISLAIQMIMADQGRIPSLVFDEVDSGVGGGIAEIVGRHLRELGKTRQVMCVTHLPQVASQANHHMQVQKLSGDSQTRTSIRQLDDQERIHETARMLGGVEITRQTLSHAEEMIIRANA